MPIESWFPTHVYKEELHPSEKAQQRYNADLVGECERLREFDTAGRAWCAKNYPGGYTSYASMNQLHRFSSTFEDLRTKLDKHVARFAKHLEYDLDGGHLEMVDCWVNMMPRQVMHGSHIHPLSVISGTYYVQTPPGVSQIKFEDPRLGFMMAMPPRKARHRPDSRQHVGYTPQAGEVILFESWLRHEVAANQSEPERISISFNYQWTHARRGSEA